MTNNGKIYICGTDLLGVLGLENSKWQEFHSFKKLQTLDNEFIVEVSCAEFHTLGLTKDGVVYAWGGNLHNVFFYSLLF